MTLYALIDEDLQIARNPSRGTKAIFLSLKLLKKHAWEYQAHNEKYVVAKIEIEESYEFEDLEVE